MNQIKNHLTLFLSCLISGLAMAQPSQENLNRFQKKFRKSGNIQTESIQTNLYKPGKSLNYFWNAFDWMFTGNSLMTYTPSGKISTRIDSGFFYRKTSYTYDAEQRETERLEQNYNSGTSLWENDQREVNMFDAQGALQENRTDQWNGASWFPMNGEKHIRNYNPQNLLLEDIQQTWNMMDSVWVNDYMETEYVYDGLSRLQSYISKNWNDSASVWVNEEKSVWQYGTDNKPSQVILQEWNGSAFVDSVRITDISWNFWNGNLLQSDPAQYTMQKLAGGNWVNNMRFTITRDLNGSYTYLNELYVNGNWVPASRMRFLFDEQQNPVVSINENYNPGTLSFDTAFCTSFQSTYDNQGRILEQVVYHWDADLHQLEPMSKQEFSQHSMFTSFSSASSLQAFRAVPNPVLSGSSLSIPGASGIYRIRNVSGASVQSGLFETGGTLSTESLLPGLYLIEFQNEIRGKGSVRISVY